MAIEGEYEPSPAKWVRDQVETFEATNGQEANTLPGTDDPIVPHKLADLSRLSLGKRGYQVEWHTYPMPHAVCAEEVEASSACRGRGRP